MLAGTRSGPSDMTKGNEVASEAAQAIQRARDHAVFYFKVDAGVLAGVIALLSAVQIGTTEALDLAVENYRSVHALIILALIALAQEGFCSLVGGSNDQKVAKVIGALQLVVAVVHLLGYFMIGGYFSGQLAGLFECIHGQACAGLITPGDGATP